MKSIKDRLIELREEHELNKVEMAKKIGVSKSSITRFENGEIKPSLDQMIHISQLFGVSLDWLAGFDTEVKLDYDSLVNECINSDISPEKLKAAIQLLKSMKG